MAKANGSEPERRKFVFQSFTDRIAAIKIDPIRVKGKKWEIVEDETSYFITAFDHWRELNLTTIFTDFAYKCYPLCRSLPMVLHNQNAILDLLIEYLRKADKNSIEPMVDLLTKFVRDLGADFEPHYAVTLQTIIDIVSGTTEKPVLEIVESSFTGLAYIFKYLSRLLVADLRPTFDFLAPLFGKHGKQPGYVLRFAAESLGFLIRKSNPEALHEIVDHVFKSLEENTKNTYYIKSLSTLFSSTLKSTGNVLHSKTPSLVDELVRSASSRGPICWTLLADVFVDALHHVRKDTAGPFYEAVITSLHKYKNTELTFKVLLIIAGLRKGDRVSEWAPIYELLLDSLKSKETHSSDAIAAVSVIISTADFGDTTKYYTKVIDQFKNSPTSLYKIFTIIKEENPNVFTTFVVDQSLSKSIGENASLEELGLFLSFIRPALPDNKVAKIQLKSKALRQKSYNSISGSDYDLFYLWWRFFSFKKFVTLSSDYTKLLFEVINFQVRDDSYKGIQAELVGELIAACTLDSKELDRVVKSLSKLQMRESVLVALLEKLVDVSKERAIEYARIISDYCMSWDARIRHAAVDICRRLVPNDVLDMCLIIDDIPQDLQNARNLSMRIRNLMTKYCTTGTNEVLDEVVPKFFFGILSSRFQPIWKEVISVISQLYEKCGNKAWDLAYSWISSPPSQQNLFSGEELSFASKDEHYYACSNLERVQKIHGDIIAKFDSPVQALKAFAASRTNIPVYNDLKGLAIKSLIKAPKLAEKHGDALSPYLILPKSTEADSNTAYTDTFSLLELFSKFRKPTKLSNFDKIYQVYLLHLSSNHRPLQKVALACVLSVNTSETDILRKYRTDLEAFTDDAQFNSQVAVFFAKDGTERENSVHEKDRGVVLPIAARLLYGHAKISKSSAGDAKSSQRNAVLSTVSNYFEEKYQRLFVDIAIESVDFSLTVPSIRRQQGALSLLTDLTDVFKTSIRPVADQIVPIIVKAFGVVNSYDSNDEEKIGDVTPNMIKQVRQSSTKLIENLFGLVPEKDFWLPYWNDIYSLLIEPKLPRLAVENLEQPSALMGIFLTLSGELELVELLETNDGIIVTTLFSALTEPRIKESVVKHDFLIARNLIEANSRELIAKFEDQVIISFPDLLEKRFSSQTVEVMVNVLLDISAQESKFTVESLEKIITAELSVFEKNTPLPAGVKVGLLQTLEALLLHKLCPRSIIEHAYTVMARLFRQFSDPQIRVQLSACYLAFSHKIPEYERLGKLVVELNSYDKKRLGGPDFDRRLTTFETINEKLYTELRATEWNVLLYNMLFFMKDPEEFSLRNSAVYTLKRFINVYADKSAPEDLKVLINGILMPAIKLGMREANETFRELFVEVLATVVRDASEVIPEGAELQPLLRDGDEEANFFNNIFHIQAHRRQRAVNRLASIAASGELNGSAISQFLIPLIEQYAQKQNKSNPDVNSLAAESSRTISELAKLLTFNQYRALTRRYVSACVSDTMNIKKTIRLVNAVGEALDSYINTDKVKETVLSKFSLTEVVNPLHKVMSIKTTNEQNLTERVAIAIPVVLFLRSLPKSELELELPGKLTWLCQLLRAKTQELRDLVRSTLNKVVKILGTQYLVYVVKELKAGLTRGSQLHVLGYTIHSILVAIQSGLDAGDLNASAPLMSSIIMEDIFGAIGEEKDAEGYNTNAKEVKAHKSYDSGFILAQNISLSEFWSLIMPVKNFLLQKKLNLKSERKVHDLLHRFSNGLQKNEDAQSQTALIALYQLNELCLKTKKDEEARMQDLDTSDMPKDHRSAKERAAKESEEFFTVRLSSRNWDGVSYNESKHIGNLHLLQSFVLEALRVVLKSEGLLNPANVKGLLPIIEEGIKSTYEDVQISALKLGALCLKVPIENMDERILSIGRKALGLIKTTSATSSDLFQASLKFITVILRSVDEFKLKDSAYAYILDRIKPDIEEPGRQSATVSFVKSLLSTKLMIPELYEVMEKISEVMVTNQDSSIRASCRTAYLKFLLDYPHGQHRLDKYFAFLVSNLEYPTFSGRLSVLEMIRMVVHKVHEDHTDTVLTSFFVGLVLVLVNDTDQNCRNAALQLVKDILGRADSDSEKVMVDFCMSWLAYLGHNDSLVRAAFEAGCLMKGHGYMDRYPKLAQKLSATVKAILEGSQKGSHEESDWQLVYLALKYVSEDTVLVEKYFDLIETTLLYPHPWVRAHSARIFGSHYAKAKANGHKIETDILTAHAKRFVRQIGAPQVADTHATQIVKNLVFIVQLWVAENATLTLKDGTDQSCIEYLVHKLSVSARTDINSDDFAGGKKAIVQLFAVLAQTLEIDDVKKIAPECTTALYLLIDQLRSDKSELSGLCREALEIFEQRLGTSEFVKLYNASRQLVEEKRRERKAKRSLEAVMQPEIHAKKRLKKNLNQRNARKKKTEKLRRSGK